MNYKQRIDKVIDYIGKNLDGDLTLDILGDIACLSKYHFHRIFSAYMGLSLQQYIRWLRLKRAAHQLIVYPELSILNIALDAGFDSHESFTRAFKQVSGFSPSEFRKKMQWDAWEKPPYNFDCHTAHNVNLNQEKSNMNVVIEYKPARRLAVLEHRGSPAKIAQSVAQLIAWAKAQPISIKPKPGDAFGFAYDDPNQVLPEAFRFDLALTIPDTFQVHDEVIITKTLAAGRYAVVLHKGSRNNIGDTVYGVYRNWLGNSNEELADFPCLFCYYNFDHEVADTELITECWFLLKDKFAT